MLATIAQRSNPGSGVLVGVLVFYLAIAVLGFIAGWKVLTKAGYSGWWIFISLVPLVGVVMFFVFAFSDWPVLKEVRMLRAGPSPTPYQSYGPPPVPPPPFQS